MSPFTSSAGLALFLAALSGPAFGQASFSSQRPAASHTLPLSVVDVSPDAYSIAPRGTAIQVDFDVPVLASSVTPASLRVFGQSSGPHTGTVSWSNGNRTLTFQPALAFAAGEVVVISLSHDVRNQVGVPLREAGYSWRFHVATSPGTSNYTLAYTITTAAAPVHWLTVMPPIDLDGDGYLDLVAVNGVESSSLCTFLNAADGSGQFVPAGPTFPVGYIAGEGRTGDFDSDGRVDLAIVSVFATHVALGDGNGGFSHVTTYPLPTQPLENYYDIGVMDLNGDGSDDLVCPGVGNNESLHVLVNDRTGSFATILDWAHGMDGAHCVAEGDLNADGITDLTVFGGSSFGKEYVVQVGTEDGGLIAMAPPAQNPAGAIVAVMCDNDGDGDADVVAVGSQTDKISVLRGTGTGTFDSITSFTAGVWVVSVDMRDFDADGRLDLAAASLLDGRANLYRKLPGPGYQLSSSMLTPKYCSDAVLFDFDNDGDLDAAVADEDARQILIFRNL